MEPTIIPTKEELEERGLVDDEENEVDSHISIDIIKSDNGRFHVVCIETPHGSFPFYTDICTVPQLPKFPDERKFDIRNGTWDWLKHFIPNLTFRTTDYKQYMEINDDTEGDARAVVLEEGNSGEYVMGLYLVDPQLTAGDENTVALIDKINYLIGYNMSGTAMSFHGKSGNIESLCVNEDVILGLIDIDNEDEE